MGPTWTNLPFSGVVEWGYTSLSIKRITSRLMEKEPRYCRYGRVSRFVVWMQATACEDEPFDGRLGLEERSTACADTHFRIWLRSLATVPAVATDEIVRGRQYRPSSLARH